ncbi:helix-turn-helix transcriptional regulator [Variovorax sp. NFACC27]|uniref:helix-turn-helix domain-containing protein n=1 Tax=unclassified Variovorax TaxID=663243 RepID=UPI000895B86C|nr:hypothetical protein SAMN03159371_07326 [Variovorax sp. NFACC28]SEG98198.1 hypothetical protein SAMN03159365_07137 [Variovorax sp. NFACC29]SFE05533.1 hypothetical protein SAMN03159379_07157 [Variovorax sp. NFACC26]SFH13347.1 hypothetical protein SAMN03159447_06824 [Variovorax sp. NFACC27]
MTTHPSSPQPQIASNLLTLAESFHSISEFCVRVGVNRQQFNKYLAGKHVPSQRILVRIAKYFHMDASDLALPADAFRRFYEGLDEAASDLVKLSGVSELLRIAQAAGAELQAFHGLYFRYHQSAIYKGKVLRSVTRMFERDGLTQYVTVERFPELDGGARTAFSFVYRGFCTLMGDRIFMVDFESKQRNELTFTVLTPQHRTPVRFLFGVVTGVAATSYRQPFSARVALAREADSPLRRQHLRLATVLDMEASAIPPEVRRYLGGPAGQPLIGGEG